MSILRSFVNQVLGTAVITSTSSIVYTVPNHKRSAIRSITAVNTTAGALTFSLSIDGNLLIEDQSISANSKYDYNTLKVMDGGEYIYARASGSGVYLFVDGALV